MGRKNGWMAYEDRKLKEYWMEGMPDEEIAFYLGRSVMAIGARRQLLRLVKQKRPFLASPHNMHNTHNSSGG